MASKDDLLLPSWLKWLLGFTLPTIAIFMGTMVTISFQVKTDLAVVKRDVANAVSVAYKNEKDIEDHLIPKDRFPHPLIEKDINNLQEKIEELSKK